MDGGVLLLPKGRHGDDIFQPMLAGRRRTFGGKGIYFTGTPRNTPLDVFLRNRKARDDTSVGTYKLGVSISRVFKNTGVRVFMETVRIIETYVYSVY